MKFDLPCEIVKDLLPIYADGLTGESTSESVEEHLKHCPNCKAAYSAMKEKCSVNGGTKNDDQEKALFKKINRKMNKRSKAIAVTGLIAVIAVFGLTGCLFNSGIKDVPVSDVTVTAAVYPLEDISTELPDGVVVSGDTVQISKSENDGSPEFSVTFPNSAYEMTVSQNVINECGYVSIISWSSPYVLKDIKYEYKETDGKNVMYITGFKTSLLGNKVSGNGTTTDTIEFQATDRIVYVDQNGNETNMWER